MPFLGWLDGIAQTQQLDFGDAPDAPYPTFLKNNGARHILSPGFSLGQKVDVESDGLPNTTATGDDLAPVNSVDDEDGVVFTSALVQGQTASVNVTVVGEGFLNAWVDFNGNGSWADTGEQIFIGIPVGAGVNSLTFPVPGSAKAGLTFARFRLSHQRQLSFVGLAPDGEVEDYQVAIGQREQPGRCDLSCEGLDFWLTFPGNYAPDPINPVRPRLCIVGNPGTAVSINIPGLRSPFSANVIIPAGMMVDVLLPSGADLGDANDLILNRGIHVVATSPVSIYALSKVEFSSDGYLALPTEALGTDYYVMSFGNAHTDVPELNGSQFAIVACETNTLVGIIPSAVTGVHNAGVPYLITLNAGETYQLRTTEGAPSDLTGTRIVSSKPIAVFGSHACANVRSSDPSFCDYLVEQMLPVSRWSTEFYARRLATRIGGDTFRVLASQNNTIVSFNGVATATLARGEFVERVRPPTAVGNGTQITANHPVLVAQYANSSDYDLVVNSDPFMSLVPGRPLFSAQHKFCVPSGFLTHHINVISPTAAIGTVKLDGIAVGGFSVISGTLFSSATTTVSTGVHTVTAGQPVGVNVYGWNKYESYGWPSCLFFGDTTPPSVTCPPGVTVTLGGNITGAVTCKAAVPDFRSQVSSTDNCPLGAGTFQGPGPTQNPPPGTLVGPGVHQVTVSVSDASGNIGTCTTTFTVVDPNPNTNAPPVLHCPGDMVVKCAGTNGAFVEYQASATTGCQDVPLQCDPPSGSLFPVGTTTVTCTLPGTSPPQACTFKVTVSCAEFGLALSNTQLTISWGGGSVLEMADSPSGPWTVVPNTTTTFTVNTSENKQKFYRVR